MTRSVLWRNRFNLTGCILTVMGTILIGGCAISGRVVSTGNFETALTDMQVENGNVIKVYYGGASRLIPLKEINTLIINPSEPLTIDNVLCYTAEISLKDGTRIQSTEKDRSLRTQVFVCAHHELVGKRNREHFRTGFENILRLIVE